MQSFDVPLDDRIALLPCHRAFQATIAHRANEALGLAHPPQGIGRYQGGVMINGRQLVINPDNVAQSWSGTSAPTREEIAVADAIMSVVQDFRRLGDRVLVMPPPETPLGSALQDPLRWFFRPTGMQL